MATTMRLHVGQRVECDAPAPPYTGAGLVGTIIGIAEVSSTITGASLRWTSIDIRLAHGAIVSRQPSQLRALRAAKEA